MTNKPVLVLQYPDPRQGRTVAIAATKSPKAFKCFKEVVLEEAGLALMDWTEDQVLQLQDQAELTRLKATLDVLIPDIDT